MFIDLLFSTFRLSLYLLGTLVTFLLCFFWGQASFFKVSLLLFFMIFLLLLLQDTICALH